MVQGPPTFSMIYDVTTEAELSRCCLSQDPLCMLGIGQIACSRETWPGKLWTQSLTGRERRSWCAVSCLEVSSCKGICAIFLEVQISDYDCFLTWMGMLKARHAILSSWAQLTCSLSYHALTAQCATSSGLIVKSGRKLFCLDSFFSRCTVRWCERVQRVSKLTVQVCVCLWACYCEWSQCLLKALRKCRLRGLTYLRSGKGHQAER